MRVFPGQSYLSSSGKRDYLPRVLLSILGRRETTLPRVLPVPREERLPCPVYSCYPGWWCTLPCLYCPVHHPGYTTTRYTAGHRTTLPVCYAAGLGRVSWAQRASWAWVTCPSEGTLLSVVTLPRGGSAGSPGVGRAGAGKDWIRTG